MKASEQTLPSADIPSTLADRRSLEVRSAPALSPKGRGEPVRDELLGYGPLLRMAVRHFDGDHEVLAAWVESLPQLVVERLKADWWWQAHGGQREPAGDWTV